MTITMISVRVALAAAMTIGSIISYAETLLLRQPSVSRNHIAFVYAGDIWVANRDGQNPLRLTSQPADEFAPSFSPD